MSKQAIGKVSGLVKKVIRVAIFFVVVGIEAYLVKYQGYDIEQAVVCTLIGSMWFAATLYASD